MKAINEAVVLLEKEGKPILQQAIKNDYSGRIALRITPELHRSLAIKVIQRGESINILRRRYPNKVFKRYFGK